MKEENNNINGVVIAFAIFGALFAAIVFMSAAMFYQILKTQETQNSNNSTKIEQPFETSQDEPEEMFRDYMKTMQTSIKKNWNPPKGDTSRQVVLFFKIAKDGSLKNYSVLQSSGNDKTDEAAIEALKAAAPFAPLPEEYTKDDIDIQFTFDYNVFDKNNNKK